MENDVVVHREGFDKIVTCPDGLQLMDAISFRHKVTVDIMPPYGPAQISDARERAVLQHDRDIRQGKV